MGCMKSDKKVVVSFNKVRGYPTQENKGTAPEGMFQ
jgi:hypothetical protein